MAPSADQARYAPVQSISYEFGSKLVSGYFLQQSERCQVTLMIIEKSDPDAAAAFAPARVRLALMPGQRLDLDSEGGQPLNFACAPGASALVVQVGNTQSSADRQPQAQAQSSLAAAWPATPTAADN